MTETRRPDPTSTHSGEKEPLVHVCGSGSSENHETSVASLGPDGGPPPGHREGSSYSSKGEQKGTDSFCGNILAAIGVSFEARDAP